MSNSFSSWTPADVARFNARTTPQNRIPVPDDAAEREGDLHDQILTECRKRGWIAFHGSMASRTKRTEGEFDFIILSESRVHFIECKARGGKLSKAQLEIHAWATKLGHSPKVVWSFEQFLEVVK